MVPSAQWHLVYEYTDQCPAKWRFLSRSFPSYRPYRKRSSAAMTLNVTSFTCEYGLVLDAAGGCGTTIASLDYTSYKVVRVAYGVAGLVALFAAAYKLGLALQFRGEAVLLD